MLEAQSFGKELSNLSYNFYSGVPCSFLKYLINYAINEEDFVMAANEGDAVAICAGAYLGGRKSVFLCQNSGLANAVSPLTSLTYTFKIPVLGFVSLRGEQGLNDEPQHELMGQITGQLLETMQINYAILSTNFDEAIVQLKEADKYIENGESFFFIVKKGTFDKVALKPVEPVDKVGQRVNFSNKDLMLPKRINVLNQVRNSIDKDTLILATTGLTGRELYELGDTHNQLYMVGSMGCISSIGLGLAIAQPTKKIIAIDGDGALLMRMGTMATLGYYKPANLYHLLLDNQSHESTGSQFTVSGGVDFVGIAKSTAYTQINKLSNLEDLKESITNWYNDEQLTFSYLKTSVGTSPTLGRPSVTPAQVKERFMEYLKK